jgi:glucosamine-phosphate N-acetyltransferase
MSEIKYINLKELLDANPNIIETIKTQYLLLLSELTVTNYIETSLFVKNVERISEMGAIIVGVIDNSLKDIEIVASGTIIIEPKIIREGRNVGHIEDIVVSKEMRGKGISQKILDILKLIAREKNCYKVILDCDENVKNVYIKNGFNIKGFQMSEYF